MRFEPRKFFIILPIAAVIAVSGVLYLLTCPGDITWDHNAQDSGDLITCAHILGIPHPTGYPLYTMVGHLFTRLDFGIFSADPNPINNSAFKLTLFVIFTSLANMFLFWRVHMAMQHKLGMRIAGAPAGSIAAGIGALALGTSYLYWSQSIVPEVYLLNLFFIDLTLLAILSLTPDGDTQPPSWRWLVLGLVGGLGFFHHLSFGLFLPGFIILAIICLKKPGKKDVVLLIAGIILSMLPLLYLPIRSAQNPPVDTTNPETLSNFWYHITAKAYRPYLFLRPIGEMFNHLNEFYLKEQFGFAGVILICAGVIGIYLRRSRLAAAFTAFCLISTVFVLIHATNYHVQDRKIFFLPAFFVMAHLMALGISFVFDAAARITSRRVIGWALVFILALGGMVWQVSAVRHAYDWNIDISKSYSAKAYGSQAFANLDANAIIFTWFDGPSFSLIYHRFVLFEGIREDVDIVFLPRVQSPWWWENVEDGHPNIDMTISYMIDRNAIIENIINTNIEKRPVYTSWAMIPLPEGYELIKVGKLFQVITAEEYEQLRERFHGLSNQPMKWEPTESSETSQGS